MSIEFERITKDNYRAALALTLPATQRKFVASNQQSLAEAYVWPAARPCLVRHDGQPVGFVMTFPFEQDGRAALNLVRIMIDRRFQRRGLGRAVMGRLLDDSRAEGFCLMTLSVLPDNRVAISLYESLGFRNVGQEAGELRFERELCATPECVLRRGERQLGLMEAGDEFEAKKAVTTDHDPVSGAC